MHVCDSAGHAVKSSLKTLLLKAELLKQHVQTRLLLLASQPRHMQNGIHVLFTAQLGLKEIWGFVSLNIDMASLPRCAARPMA